MKPRARGRTSRNAESDRRRDPRRARRRSPRLEPLENRRLLSAIVWTNETLLSRDPNADNFVAAFGPDAPLAREDVRQAIVDWERVIGSFNYTNVGQAGNAGQPNTFLLDLTASTLPLKPGQLGALDSATTDQSFDYTVAGKVVNVGKPYTASVFLSSDGGGHGWYFDPNPALNTRFTQNVTAFSAQGDLGNKEDFFTAVLREIGQAIGIAPQWLPEAFGASAGRVGQDPMNPNYLLLSVPYFDRGTNQLGRTLFTQAGNVGLYGGNVVPTSAEPLGEGLFLFPNDLMDAFQPVNTRELISDTDVGLLVAGYNQFPGTPGYTLAYPSDLGMTLFTYLNPDTHVLTVTADPSVANNDIELIPTASTLLVQTNGGIHRFPASQVRSVVIDGGPGNDTIRVPGDVLPFGVQVNGGGKDTLFLGQTATAHNYTVNSSSVSVASQPPIGTTFGRFLSAASVSRQVSRVRIGAGLQGGVRPGFGRLFRSAESVVNFQGLSGLTITGNGSDNTTVATTAAGTTVTAFGMKSVSVGSRGSVAGVQGPVKVAGFGFGSTDLTIDDSADKTPRSAVIGSASVTSLAPAPITYDGVSLHSLTVLGGSAANQFTVAATPQNSAGNLTTQVTMGAGPDNVSVLSTSSSLGVNLGGGTNHLTVVPSALANTLSISATGGTFGLTVDDLSDTTPRTVDLGTELFPASTKTGSGRFLFTQLEAIDTINGFSPNGEIVFSPASLANTGLVIQTGRSDPNAPVPTGDSITLETTPNVPTLLELDSEADQVGVATTGGPLNIDGTKGPDGLVTLGAEYGLVSFLSAPVGVYNTGLDIENQNSGGTESVAVAPTALSINGSVVAQYGNLTHLSYEGNAANDTYQILASPGGNLAVHAGTGNDTFTVSGPTNTLDGFGNVNLDGGGGADSLTIRDASPTRGLTYNAQAVTSHGGAQTVIQRTGGASIAINRIPQTVLDTGDGGDTVNLQGVAPDTSLAIHGGAGNDRFSIQGPLTGANVSIDGGGGVNTLDYSAYPVAGSTVTSGTLPSGIVSWYKAEGNANDSIGNNNGVATNVTYGPGEVGQAFVFNNGYVQVPDARSLDSPTLTVEAWVKATAPGDYAYIVDKGINQDIAASYGLYTGNTGGLFFYVYNGVSTPISPDAGTGIWDGRWHHVAGTFDGSTVRLYVDGQQIGNGTPATGPIDYNLPGGNDVAIGDYLGPGVWNFNGSVDELSIYNRALSASEIQAIFNAGSAGKTAAPPPSSPGVEVDLATGTATGLSGGISRIQNVIGSPGNDILVGNGGNVLNGLGGADLLIAGPSASALSGTGADVLIGGQTALDRNIGALEAALADWTNPGATLAARVSALVHGPFASGTISSNKQRNTLNGGTGPNLFFASSGDSTNETNADASISL